MNVRQCGICTMAALAGFTTATAAQQPTVRDRVRAALEMPRLADSVHKHGGPEKDIRVVFDEVAKRRIPATETRDVLQQTDAAIKQHGPVDNFGAFVQAQLASGKRGRALAQAIRAEHERRGIGNAQRRGAKNAAQTAGRDTKGKAASKTPTKTSAKTATKASTTKTAAKTPSKTTTKTPAKSTTKAATKTKGGRP